MALVRGTHLSLTLEWESCGIKAAQTIEWYEVQSQKQCRRRGEIITEFRQSLGSLKRGFRPVKGSAYMDRKGKQDFSLSQDTAQLSGLGMPRTLMMPAMAP